jgi:hypothetical protein
MKLFDEFTSCYGGAMTEVRFFQLLDYVYSYCLV